MITNILIFLGVWLALMIITSLIHPDLRGVWKFLWQITRNKDDE